MQRGKNGQVYQQSQHQLQLGQAVPNSISERKFPKIIMTSIFRQPKSGITINKGGSKGGGQGGHALPQDAEVAFWSTAIILIQ